MNGHCDGCDKFSNRLLRKGALWLCARCLEREL